MLLLKPKLQFTLNLHKNWLEMLPNKCIDYVLLELHTSFVCFETSSLLSNQCNDIATLSCTDTSTLEWTFYFLKFGPNLSM